MKIAQGVVCDPTPVFDGMYLFNAGGSLDRYIAANIVDGASLYQTRLQGANSVINTLGLQFLHGHRGTGNRRGRRKMGKNYRKTCGLVCFVVCLTVLFIFGPKDTYAKIITANSGSTADLQAAINAADSGDTVQIPEGNFEFSGSVTCNAGITIAGAGQSLTILSKTGSSTQAMIIVNGSNEQPVTITGISFNGIDNSTTDILDKGIQLINGCKDFRIYDCVFKRFGHAAIYTRGNCRGVISNCRFINIYRSTIGNYGYGVVVHGDGDASWSRPLGLGSENAVFVEDCYFTGNRHSIASNNGSRYVFRYNEIEDNLYGSAIDAHGLEYGSSRGSRSYEIYGNTVENSENTYIGIAIRGGDGVIFDNEIISGVVVPIVLTNTWDQDDQSADYPRQDQIRDLHIWSNTFQGNPVCANVREGYEDIIQEGRDYFCYKPDNSEYTPYTYPHPLVDGGELSINTSSLSDATTNQAYSFSLQARNGTSPYSWSLMSGSLPAGLTLSSDGIISGTPTQSGQSTCVVQVTDADDSTDTKEFTLSVLNADDLNLANGTTHISDSENFGATEPVENLWDGEYSQQAGSPGNSGIDSFWVEFDLGKMYDLSLIRFYGDAEGTWVSKRYSVLVKVEETDEYTPIIDDEDCFSTDMYQTVLSDVSARYLRLVVVGDTVAHATQCREFVVFGTPSTTAVPDAPTGIDASDGAYADKVTISWDPVAGATGYDVYRNTADDSSTASIIFSTSLSTSGDDESVESGRTYYYWVKAKKTTDGDILESSFGDADTGYASEVASEDPDSPSGDSCFISSGGDMIKSAWIFDAQRTGHI